MIPMRSFARLVAATALVAAAFIVAPSSPVGAVEPTTTIPPDPTGSLVDNGDGTATLTYANVETEGGRLLQVVFLPSGASCGASPVASYSVNSLVLTSQLPDFPASPMLISTATTVLSYPNWPNTLPELVTLPAGEYATCLYLTVGPQFELSSSAPITIVGSAPAPEPVTPAYTG